LAAVQLLIVINLIKNKP